MEKELLLDVVQKRVKNLSMHLKGTVKEPNNTKRRHAAVMHFSVRNRPHRINSFVKFPLE
jgi:hypothetical protein